MEVKQQNLHRDQQQEVTDFSSLCSVCQNIATSKMRGPDLDQMQPHQPSYLALKLSAETGCRLCQFLIVALATGSSDDDAAESAAAWKQVSPKYPGREISLQAWGGIGRQFDRIFVITTGDIPAGDDSDGADDPTVHPDHQLALSGKVDIFAYEDDAAASHGGVSGRPLPVGSGNSDQDWRQIDYWIPMCRDQHSLCRKPDQGTRLPTRVVDVGPADSSAEPFLYETSGSSGLYVTLSHCWGGKVSLTTTSKDIRIRKQSLPFSSLPKSFRDAVEVTRRLGIRYLWIDSLCIIQDSKEDWERESAMMESIYRHGYLNISARGAANSTVGLFFDRDPEPPLCRLNWICENCDECSMEGSIYIRSPTLQHANVRESHCDRRGWILQEQLLAARVLYFDTDQLAWECCETSVRQDGRADDNALSRFGNFSDFKIALGLGAVSHCTAVLNSSNFSWWAVIVKEYTRRNLTYMSDKLVALSGIARAYQKETGKTYIAGNWREELFESLLWYRNCGKRTVAEKQPSWSWSKMGGSIGFAAGHRPRFAESMVATLQDVRVQSKDSLNPFDDVASAEIDLEGYIQRVVHKNISSMESKYDRLGIYSMCGLPLGSVIWDASDPPENSDNELYCILLTKDVYASGLILLSHPSKPGCFKRVGFFTARKKGGPQYESVTRFLSGDRRRITVL